MAISFVNSATSGTLVCNKPASTQQNDCMVGFVCSHDNTSQVITPPSGWTLVKRFDGTLGFANTLAIYFLIAGASEPASYTWTSDQNSGIGSQILTYRGTDLTFPFENTGGVAISSTNSGTGTTSTGLSITLSRSDSVLLFLENGIFFTSSVGSMTNRAESVTNDSTGQDSYDQQLNASGATGNRTGTMSGNNDWFNVMLALQTPTSTVVPDRAALLTESFLMPSSKLLA